jgi:predicted Zn-dependent peptidase
VSSHPNAFADTGMLNISLGLDGANLEKSLRLIRAEAERLKSVPPKPAELRRAKEYAIGISRMSLERTSAQNMRAGTSVLIYEEIQDPEIVHEKLRAVQADEITDAAIAFLDFSKCTAAVIGPDPRKDLVESLLS